MNNEDLIEKYHNSYYNPYSKTFLDITDEYFGFSNADAIKIIIDLDGINDDYELVNALNELGDIEFGSVIANSESQAIGVYLIHQQEKNGTITLDSPIHKFVSTRATIFGEYYSQFGYVAYHIDRVLYLVFKV